MRRLTVALLIVVLGTSFFGASTSQTLAQAPKKPTPPLPVTRWMHFRGAITQWGDETFHGSVTVKTRTLNVPLPIFKPWVTARAFWSNEPRPIASNPIPVGITTFTHYKARLVRLIALRGKQEAMNLNITGIWNVNKFKITSEFDEKGVLLKSMLEVTPIVTGARGQLHITEGWKEFDLEIEGIDTVKGIEISMITTTRMMHPFSFEGASLPTLKDLFQIMRHFRAMPGFGNYDPELDYNGDSKIDIADLTTVAANM